MSIQNVDVAEQEFNTNEKYYYEGGGYYVIVLSGKATTEWLGSSIRTGMNSKRRRSRSAFAKKAATIQILIKFLFFFPDFHAREPHRLGVSIIDASHSATVVKIQKKISENI